jgi:pimeloyl-ACP methyl ester carboxylesterase
VLVTAASVAYNLATAGRERPARALYRGPFVTVGHTLVAYREWGRTGSPIILLGGFAEPTWVWHAVGPLLARRHRVVALDLPPFGFTQRGGAPSLTSWTALVEGLARRLRLHRPVIVGHSLGAAVAAAVALRDPRDVARIVLLDGDGEPGDGAGGGLVGALLVDPYFTTAYRLLTGSDFLFRRVLERALGPNGPPVTRAMLDAFERPFLVQGTAQALRAMVPHGILGLTPAELARVRVPATVVWGRLDSVDGLDAGRRTAAVLHAPFQVIPGAGHLSMLVRPAAVAAAILRAAAGRPPA